VTVVVHTLSVGIAACPCGDTVTLTANTNNPGAGVTWSPGGSTSPSISVAQGTGTTYTATVTCGPFSASATHTVESAPALNLVAPTAFVADGVGRFDIYQTGMAIGQTPAYFASRWRFEVIDRWGQTPVVLQGNVEPCGELGNAQIPSWDGRRNVGGNDYLQIGEYLYRFYLGDCDENLAVVPVNGTTLPTLTYLR
jgi:hypothetical protein